MSETITWEWFMRNRHLHRRAVGGGLEYYSASIHLNGKGYNSGEFTYLPDADAHLIEIITEDGYTVDGYTPPDSPTEPIAHDPVNNPEHYTRGGIECIDAIQAALTPEEFRGFCKGNALKYIWRAEHKGKPKEDLKKSIWYLDRLGGGE